MRRTGGATAGEGSVANTGYLAIYKFTLVLRAAPGPKTLLLAVLLAVWRLFVAGDVPGTTGRGDEAGGGTPPQSPKTEPPAQTDDRLTTATTQLRDENVDVRLNGIASLRRIMKKSSSDQRQVVSLLTDYIDRHSDESTQRDRPQGDAERAEEDVIAATRAIGARDSRYDGSEHVKMDSIHLSQAPLRGVNLSGADPRGTDLRGADLSSADLSGADLRDANLYEVNLYGARLVEADLTNADKTRVGLERAVLTGVEGLPPGFPDNP